MKKILYLMHVPWGWIKQRPHFIAENLADHYDITVCYQKPYRQNRQTGKIGSARLSFLELLVLPFSRFSLIAWFNRLLLGFQLRSNVKRFDIIWVTHPALYEHIGQDVAEGTCLVYDCMDDALEFPEVKHDPQLRMRMESLERALVRRADIVFASSRYLGAIIQERCQPGKDIIVLNNGLDQNRLDASSAQLSSEVLARLDRIAFKKVMYLGTIAGWMDFDLILKSLDALPDIAYVFVGPIDVAPPRHDRIFLFPPVEHAQVFSLMARADVLVMPFIVNDLIRSVNPVKVYEYIYSGKPTVVVSYGETQQFARFVSLYSSTDEYVGALRSCTSEACGRGNGSYSQAREFVLNNTWDKRAQYVKDVLP